MPALPLSRPVRLRTGRNPQAAGARTDVHEAALPSRCRGARGGRPVRRGPGSGGIRDDLDEALREAHRPLRDAPSERREPGVGAVHRDGGRLHPHVALDLLAPDREGARRARPPRPAGRCRAGGGPALRTVRARCPRDEEGDGQSALGTALRRRVRERPHRQEPGRRDPRPGRWRRRIGRCRRPRRPSRSRRRPTTTAAATGRLWRATAVSCAWPLFTASVAATDMAGAARAPDASSRRCERSERAKEGVRGGTMGSTASSEAVALLLPVVGVVVVAVALPEARLVVVEELDATEPLRALPEVA